MTPSDAKPLLARAQRRMLATWGVFTALGVVVPAVAWPVIGPGSERLGEAWLGATHALAVALAAMSLLLRVRLLSDRKLACFLGQNGGERAIGRLDEWLRLPYLIGWITNFVVVALGVAVAVVTGRAAAMLPFVFAAGALNALACPRLEPQIRRAVAQLDAHT